MIITAITVRFFDSLSYGNSLSKANNAASSAQNQVSQEETDIQFILKHDPSQLNCYDIQSQYDGNLCSSHNQQK